MPVTEGVLLKLQYASKSLRSKHKKLKYETNIEKTKNGDTLKTQLDNSKIIFQIASYFEMAGRRTDPSSNYPCLDF